MATFEKYVGSDPNYTGANEATKAAIRQRFGVEASQPSTNEAEAIDIQSKSRLRTLKTIALSSLAWTLPSAAIYLLGIAVHWVYAGFRGKAS